jgi:2'-phosphotransferase
LLQYLGAQIFAYIELQKGTRLALEETRLMNVAFAQCIGTEDFTQHYPIEGTVTAAAALIRWGAPTAAPTSTYTNSVIARAHRLVPQQYRNWMQSGNANSLPSSTTSLWESIFDLRHGENNFAPIAGTHHLPLSWGGLVDDHTRCILDRFATILASENQNSTTGTGCMSCADLLVRPGLALVVRGALAQITNPHISSAEAVQRTQRFHRAVAAEMDPRTVGSTTEDEAHAILAEWLLWARCPMRPLAPFATPYGASCLFFYHGRTRGGSVTNMTTGFQWNIDSAGEQESNGDRMARLAEHVRKVRGELLQQEYGFNKDGSFNKHTTSLPIHRCMSDEWGENGTDDPSHGSFISAVIERLISHKTGNLHMEALEHDIAMLCPSLLRAGRPTESGGYHAMRPLAAKIQLELAGRTVAELREEDAPPAIWVPREDPEIQERLREAQKATNARIAAIKEAILARKTTSESVKEAPKKQWTQEALARSITKILRHTADSQGLAVRPDGYVLVEKLLALDQFKGVTVEEVLIATVESDQKKRHQITEEDGVLMIRAVQGHSLAAVKPEALLELIQDAAEVPICIHGTYEKAFEAIMKSQLDRMSRNEIQMAVGLPDDPEVTSGVRSSVEVLIYIDVARAMEQGIRFFRSPNNVICSPGPIPTTCFAHVARRSDGMSLLPSAFDQANQTISASPCEGNGEEPSILADLPTAVPVASQPSEKKGDKNDGQDTGTSGYKGSP